MTHLLLRTVMVLPATAGSTTYANNEGAVRQGRLATLAAVAWSRPRYGVRAEHRCDRKTTTHPRGAQPAVRGPRPSASQGGRACHLYGTSQPSGPTVRRPVRSDGSPPGVSLGAGHTPGRTAAACAGWRPAPPSDRSPSWLRDDWVNALCPNRLKPPQPEALP